MEVWLLISFTHSEEKLHDPSESSVDLSQINTSEVRESVPAQHKTENPHGKVVILSALFFSSELFQNTR